MQQLHYHMELFYWNDCPYPTVNRVECLRHMLHEYDDYWVLYYIGNPNEEHVPITFVKRDDWRPKRQPINEAELV